MPLINSDTDYPLVTDWVGADQLVLLRGATGDPQRRVSVSELLAAGNTLYVDGTDGSDTLGERGVFGRSFLTLGAAKTAASSGDTIVVYPGTYNEKNLLKTGVNWHFMPGANITYTGSSSGGIFDDSSDGAAGAVTSVITGAGIFTYQGTAGTSDRCSAVRITNASSNVQIKCKTITGSATGAFNQSAVRHKAGYLAVDADLIQGTGGSGMNYGYWWDAGESHVRANLISGIAGVYVTATGSDNSWVTADKITSSGVAGNGVEVASGNSNSRVWIDAKEIRGESIGVRIVACKNYVRCDKLSSADQPFNVSGGQLWLTVQKQSLDNTSSSAQVTDGSAWIDIQNVEDLGCNDACLDLAATTGNVVDCHVGNLKCSVSALAGIRLNQTGTGRCSFSGLIDASAATSGNPVTLGGNGTLLDGTVLISSGTRDSIVPDSGFPTINVYGVAYVTHAKNGSVTLGMGTLTTIAGMT